MGVKGLWSLLNPVARPVQIESLEGKRLAIDSSIWLYQFQATMRDKDGRVLVNAHVLGFLRRINKLLFHGIKPVFVFDGGAPNLKRNTIAERKKKKAGAAVNHARTAEKLFAAQMRREAVKAAQAQREAQAARDATAAAMRYDDDEGEQISENAVYLEDLEGRPGVSPARPKPQSVPQRQSSGKINKSSSGVEPVDPAEERRKKFRKHDPYRLPEADMPTISTEEKPDARLATEAELQEFIEEMRPSDIDIESAEFRALPTEVQYEIIGDMRIRSRQQSHKRLTEMLRRAPTALDFSMAQIKNLSQRNALTQQLLTVTDMVGKAHLTIPVRIAAERNREYVLVKRGEDAGGGWALGIREGTKANPVVVEDDKASRGSDESDSDEDSSDAASSDSEVAEIPKPDTSAVDRDLREQRRREMLEAIAARYAPKAPARPSPDLPVKSFGASRKPDAIPLFEPIEDDPFENVMPDVVPTANDEALALALQQEELGSDEDEPDPDLAKALALSREQAEAGRASPPVEQAKDAGAQEEDEDSDDFEVVESVPPSVPPSRPESVVDDADALSDESMEEVSLAPSERSTPAPLDTPPIEISDDEEDLEPVAVATQPGLSAPAPSSRPSARSASALIGSLAAAAHASPSKQAPISVTAQAPVIQAPQAAPARVAPPHGARPIDPRSQDRKDPEPVRPSPSRMPSVSHRPTVPSPLGGPSRTPSVQDMSRLGVPDHEEEPSPEAGPSTPPQQRQTAQAPSPPSPAIPLGLVAHEPERMIDEALNSGSRTSKSPFNDVPIDVEAASEIGSEQAGRADPDDTDVEDDDIHWSRSPSPEQASRDQRPGLQPEASTDSLAVDPDVSGEVDEDEGEMDAEDMAAEEDDYARFISSIKNRDLNEVRTEIDDEIRVLNNQNKVAMRDSDEITQAMVSQIQTLLRHFGIPYITAPMEAEAQCAKLAELNLVDGIITDDSDVFLFGGKQCYKNIFNDSKYAECFVLADVDRELSLTRDRLISLAYLLGSDYTIGLPGVGPVVALELLANFPGPRGIEAFKAWWTRVQRGQDTVDEADTKWKKNFKKRFASLIFLTSDWPNPLVRDAYLHPTTDESDEPFHWGFPKLSSLRTFLHEELSWSISKVDDELTPIVQRIARRGKDGALRVQGTLDPFFDLSAGAGNYAPRRRTTANVSKRLMAVIKEYREAEARVAGKQPEDVSWDIMMGGLDPEDPKGRGTGKRRKSQGSEVLDSAVSSVRGDDDATDGPLSEDAWELQALAAVEKIENGGDKPATVKKPKAPAKRKRPAKAAAQQTNGEQDDDEEADPEANFTVKKAKPRARPNLKPRSRKEVAAALSARIGVEGGDIAQDESVEGMRPVEPEPGRLTGSERRAEQKKWRRSVTAGSVAR